MKQEDLIKGTLERDEIASGMFWNLARKVAYGALHSHGVRDIDIIDECVMQCYEGLHTVKPNYNLEKWLATVSLNYYRNRIKKDILINTENKRLEDIENEMDTEYQPNVESVLNELKTRFKDLPQALKDTADLKFSENLTIDEIATKLNIKKNTVSARIYRIRQWVKNSII